MGKTKVLLVEDLLIARIAEKLILDKLDCDIDFAENGAQALELASKNVYDIILMDIGLPDLDGFEVAAAIRGLPNCGSKSQNEVLVQPLNVITPIVALTAHLGGEFKAKCNVAAIDHYLTKPLTEETGRSLINLYAKTK